MLLLCCVSFLFSRKLALVRSMLCVASAAVRCVPELSSNLWYSLSLRRGAARRGICTPTSSRNACELTRRTLPLESNRIETRARIKLIKLLAFVRIHNNTACGDLTWARRLSVVQLAGASKRQVAQIISTLHRCMSIAASLTIEAQQREQAKAQAEAEAKLLALRQQQQRFDQSAQERACSANGKKHSSRCASLSRRSSPLSLSPRAGLSSQDLSFNGGGRFSRGGSDSTRASVRSLPERAAASPVPLHSRGPSAVERTVTPQHYRARSLLASDR